MKNILLFCAMIMMGYACHAQADARVNLDLEKLTFKENPKTLIQGRSRSADRLEPLSTLPAYSVYDTKGYTFGPVKLDGESQTQFILNSVEEKKIVGLVIWFDTEVSSKAINTYIFNKYRAKPVVLEKQIQERDRQNKPYLTGSAYLWRNVRPGVSMILSKDYGTVVNGRRVEKAQLIFIDNSVKGSYQGSYKTVLDRMIATYTTKHDHD